MSQVVCAITVFSDDIIEMKMKLEGGSTFRSRVARNPLIQTTIERLDRLIHRRPEDCQREDLKLVGDLLFATLFGNEASQIIKNVVDKSTEMHLGGKTLGNLLLEYKNRARPDGPFRMSLTFAETDSAGKLGQPNNLAHFPWELLYVPGEAGGDMAAARAGLVLTRYVNDGQQLDGVSEGDRGKLELWVAWAQPAPLDGLQRIEELADRFRDLLGGPDRVELTHLREVTREKLKAQFDAVRKQKKNRPDIIHFIGHGRHEQDRGELALHKSAEQRRREENEARSLGNDDGKIRDDDWVPANELREDLHGCEPLLFFLHSCNTGRALLEGDRTLGYGRGGVEEVRGAAYAIAAVGVPYVIAMQYAITESDARSFAETFYEQLGKRSSVDDAVAAGRERLGNFDPTWGHRRFATPVVYMRADPRPLVRLEGNSQSPNRVLVPCPYASCAGSVDPGENFCSCESARSFRVCRAGHVSRATDPRCRKRGCTDPFLEEPSGPSTALAAPIPAARAPVETQPSRTQPAPESGVWASS